MQRWIVYFLLSFLILPCLSSFGQNKNIGLLISGNNRNDDQETEAAWQFLNQVSGYKATRVFLDQVLSHDDLIQFQILWYHHNDTTAAPMPDELLEIMNQYLVSGGNLLLTLETFSMINQLSLEPNPVESRYKLSEDQGYGRQLGFHAFRDHPVFEGLNGGAYVFRPMKDSTVRIHGYFDKALPLNGAVIGVDWDYIFMRENSKLMLEYWTGKGKVLAIGGYTTLYEPNKNRQHLEHFLSNCFNYLTGSASGVPVYYWQYYEQSVSRFEQDYDDLVERHSGEWEHVKPVLSLKKEKGGEQYVEVAGERMLIMGKEKGGCEEIWAHPFMALYDYQAGIKLQSGDSVLWLNHQSPEVEVTPEAFIRNYDLKNSHVRETVFVSQAEPTGVIHYDFEGTESADFFIRFKSNMRLMWPYSEKVFQMLEYSPQPFLNAIMISEGSGDFTTLIGASLDPQFVLSGQYKDYNIDWEKGNKESYCKITGITSDKFEAGGIFHFRFVPGDKLGIVITAEATMDRSSAHKAITHYKNTINNTSQLLNETQNHYISLLHKSLVIQSPDSIFNEGYKWALAATDRFFVNTPGLGGSVVAGYNNTNTGWDGEHEIDGRPGYAWYFGRDGQWSGFALLDYGDFEKVKSILEMYIKFQDLNGKIYHEVSTSGVVHYDAADATPLFIILAGKYLKHSGDIEFIRLNWDAIKNSIDFCFSTDTDGDHLIENTNVGHGWVEGGSLFGTHSSLYLTSCWAEALENAGYLAEALGLQTKANDYMVEAAIIQEIINNDFWNSNKNYLYQGKFMDGSFMDAQSILQSVPLYFHQVSKEKAGLILPVFAGNNFTSDWGCRIIGEDNPHFNPRGYHTGSVWPLFSGWAALAEYNYGNDIQGYSHLMNNLQIYKHWGLGYIEEVLNGEIYQPSGVCRHQCWSETMVLQPAIEGLLGYKADALNNVIELSPRFPADWDSVIVKNIRMGSHLVHFKFIRKEGILKYTFQNDGPGNLILKFVPQFPEGTETEILDMFETRVKGRDRFASAYFDLPVGETLFLYKAKNGIKALPLISSPHPGDRSAGMRIISDNLEEHIYSVKVEALRGTVHDLDIFIMDWKPAAVENAEVVSISGNRLILRIRFPVSAEKKYVAQEIKILLKQ